MEEEHLKERIGTKNNKITKPNLILQFRFDRYATIAYVQQSPWLMKTTIRENILFGEAYRPRRYEKVLVSCSLKQDIDLMPDGDATEIGANGLNLSGGQKQRIAIARALYSSANVVIMVINILLFHRKKITPITIKSN